MKSNKFKKQIFKILCSVFIVLVWKIFKNRHLFLSNFKTFCKEEKREIKELIHHEESVKEFCGDSCSLFKDFFIPHKGNDHKPKILRPRSLVAITLFLTILKVSVAGYLFFVYPYQAKMSEEVVNRVLQLTNIDREANNLPSLTVNPVLVASAQAKAQDLIDKNYFAHHSPDGKKPWDFISRDDYPYLFVGENLAMNFTTADSVHLALMNSPTHKKNILNEKYIEVGIAMLSGEIDGRRTNVLVELFATRKTEPAPKLASVVTNDQISTKEDSEVVEIVKKPSVDQVDTTQKTEEKEVLEIKNEEPQKQLVLLEQGEVREVSVNPTIDEKEISVLESKIEEQLQSEQLEVLGVPENSNAVNQEEFVLENENSDTFAMSQVSPNIELEKEKEVVIREVENLGDSRLLVMARISKYTRNIFTGFLILMIISLVINIVVRVEIQHKGVIVQTVFVIIFITGLIYHQTHLETVVSRIFLV